MLPAAETPSVPRPTVTPAAAISGYLPIAVAPLPSLNDEHGQNATLVQRDARDERAVGAARGEQRDLVVGDSRAVGDDEVVAEPAGAIDPRDRPAAVLRLADLRFLDRRREVVRRAAAEPLGELLSADVELERARLLPFDVDPAAHPAAEGAVVLANARLELAQRDLGVREEVVLRHLLGPAARQ